MARNGNSTQCFDPAESDEACIDPEPIADSIEDILRELIHPEKLSEAGIAKLSAFTKIRHENESASSPEVQARIRAIFKKLRPKPNELADRWAFNFVSGDPQAMQITAEACSLMLGLHKNTVSYYIQRWRKIFGYTLPGHRSQADHLGWRTRRTRRKKAEKQKKLRS